MDIPTTQLIVLTLNLQICINSCEIPHCERFSVYCRNPILLPFNHVQVISFSVDTSKFKLLLLSKIKVCFDWKQVSGIEMNGMSWIEVQWSETRWNIFWLIRAFHR